MDIHLPYNFLYPFNFHNYNHINCDYDCKIWMIIENNEYPLSFFFVVAIVILHWWTYLFSLFAYPVCDWCYISPRCRWQPQEHWASQFHSQRSSTNWQISKRWQRIYYNKVAKIAIHHVVEGCKWSPMYRENRGWISISLRRSKSWQLRRGALTQQLRSGLDNCKLRLGASTQLLHPGPELVKSR